MTESTDIETLEQLNHALGAAASPAVTAVRIEDPITSIEESLSLFVQNSLRCIEEQHSVERAIDAAITHRLPEANFGQLIEAKETYAKDRSEATGRIVTPLVSALMEERKYQEAHSGDLIGEDVIYKKANKDILQGLTALNQLLSVANKIAQDTQVVSVTKEN